MTNQRSLLKVRRQAQMLKRRGKDSVSRNSKEKTDQIQSADQMDTESQMKLKAEDGRTKKEPEDQFPKMDFN